MAHEVEDISRKEDDPSTKRTRPINTPSKSTKT